MTRILSLSKISILINRYHGPINLCIHFPRFGIFICQSAVKQSKTRSFKRMFDDLEYITGSLTGVVIFSNILL
jgi:hypothetical protein